MVKTKELFTEERERESLLEIMTEAQWQEAVHANLDAMYCNYGYGLYSRMQHYQFLKRNGEL